MLYPGYSEPLAGADAHDGPVRGNPLAPAMKELAQHFGCEQGALTGEYRHILRTKQAHLARQPERGTLPPCLGPLH